MSDEQVEVAPREVHDLVYQCCRVLGLDGAIAADVAASVTSIEICFGQGLAAFDQEITRLGQDGGSLLASPFVRAPDQWRTAELQLGASNNPELQLGPGQTIRVDFDPVAPLAALGSVLDQSRERGIGWVAVDTAPASGPSAPTGLDPIARVELDAIDPSQARPDRWQQRRTDALRNGMGLPRDLVERVQRLAATFNVSEATVDVAAGLDGVRGI